MDVGLESHGGRIEGQEIGLHWDFVKLVIIPSSVKLNPSLNQILFETNID